MPTRLRPDLFSHRFDNRQPPAPPPDAPRAARDYAGFRAMLNHRRVTLKLSFSELDFLAELPSGYSAKLLTATFKKHNQQRNIGPESMGKLLNALGVGLRIEPIEQSSAQFNFSGNLKSYQQVLRERSRKGGLSCHARMRDENRFSFHSAGGKASAAKRAVRAGNGKRQAHPRKTALKVRLELEPIED